MSKNSNRVLFVILNFNGWEESLVCMDAVLKQTYTNYHIILIDNGSHDESLEKLIHFKKNNQVTFVEEPKNLGFSGGVNIGIRHAIENDYDFVALLNNDAVIARDWLAILVDTIQKTGAASTTGLLLSGDGKKIESTGDSYSIWGLPFPRQRDQKVDQAEKSGFVFGGTAGASLYKTSLFQDIGLFDEKYFAYFEDTDISYRAQLSGYKSYYQKKALAYHDHGTTSKKMPGFTVYQTFKNLPLSYWKDTPFSLLLPVGIRFFPCYILMYIRAVLRGQILIATKGVLRSLSLLPHAFRERRRIQRKRRVSVSYIRSILYPHLPPSNKKYTHRIFHR